MTQSLLGYELRKKDSPHNCLDDACAAMKLVIARLKNQVEDTIPLTEVDVSWLLFILNFLFLLMQSLLNPLFIF